MRADKNVNDAQNRKQTIVLEDAQTEDSTPTWSNYWTTPMPSSGQRTWDASMPMEGLIKEADQAMYEAKHAGRNAYRLFKGFSRV